MLKFPTPKWHADDGGRYIGTFTATVCRDPDTGYVNVGTYRVQVHDENTVGVWMIPRQARGTSSPGSTGRGARAVRWPSCAACPPGMMTASAVGIPWNMSEYDFLGGLLETPVPVIKGQKTGIAEYPLSRTSCSKDTSRRPNRRSHEEGAVRGVARILRLGGPGRLRW